METLTDGRQISLSTETEQGVVAKATDLEVFNWTEDTKYVTSKQVAESTETVYWTVNVWGTVYVTFQTFTVTKKWMHYARFSCTKEGTSWQGEFRIFADNIEYAHMVLWDNETGQNWASFFLEVWDTIDFQWKETWTEPTPARQNSASVKR